MLSHLCLRYRKVQARKQQVDAAISKKGSCLQMKGIDISFKQK